MKYPAHGESCVAQGPTICYLFPAMPKNKPSLGYPHIEQLIDYEDFSKLNTAFEKTYHTLETLAQSKKGLKKSREALKGMKAIERVTQLLRELLEVKYRMQEAVKKE